jgi:hypothetical protein
MVELDLLSLGTLTVDMISSVAGANRAAHQLRAIARIGARASRLRAAADAFGARHALSRVIR